MIKKFIEKPIEILQTIYKEFHNLESVQTIVIKKNDNYMIGNKSFKLYFIEIFDMNYKKLYETYIASNSYKKASRLAYEQYEQEITY